MIIHLCRSDTIVQRHIVAFLVFGANRRFGKVSVPRLYLEITHLVDGYRFDCFVTNGRTCCTAIQIQGFVNASPFVKQRLSHQVFHVSVNIALSFYARIGVLGDLSKVYFSRGEWALHNTYPLRASLLRSNGNLKWSFGSES